jgi:hypothetical protein
MIPFLVYLFFLHWVGDFVFQSSWMAINKSKDFLALLTHVTIYSCILALGVALSFQYPNGLQWFFLANFVAHLATDFVTSKFTSRFYAAGRIREYFVMIGFDQFIHAATILLTTHYLLGA